MVKKVEFQNNILKILLLSNQEVVVEMQLPITQALCKEGKVFVRLKLISGKTTEQNVYCLDSLGQTLWQVQDPDLFKSGKIQSPRDFMGEIWFAADGTLWAHGTRGSDYKIDKETGYILEEIFTK